MHTCNHSQTKTAPSTEVKFERDQELLIWSNSKETHTGNQNFTVVPEIGSLIR